MCQKYNKSALTNEHSLFLVNGKIVNGETLWSPELKKKDNVLLGLEKRGFQHLTQERPHS